jgi:DNA-binding MarR family transcriptional regulator
MDSVDEALAQWRGVRPDLDLGALAILARVAKIQASVGQTLAAAYRRHGLSAADFAALAALRRTREPMSQAGLGRALALTAGTVTVRIDRLERAGLVTRADVSGDARVSWVRLTPRGAAVFDEVLPEHLRCLQTALEPLDEAQQKQLARILGVWLAALEAQDGAAARD